MAKELDPVAEADFSKKIREVTYESYLTLRALTKADAGYLKRGGYGATREEAIITEVKLTLKRLDKMAEDHLRKQGG